MIEIRMSAELPDDLLKAWLQHVRDFDTAHPGCHFSVIADAPPAMPLSLAIEMFDVTPPLPLQAIFKRKP